MKVLLINSPFSQEDGITHLPLFLAYPAAILEKNKHKVAVIDLAIDPLEKKRLIRKVRELSPDMVVINSENTVLQVKNFFQAIRISKILKKHFPKIPLILIGAHVTFRDEETMERNKEIFCIIRHSPNYALLNLANALENSNPLDLVEGITYRKNGKIIKNKDSNPACDLDLIPFPARHLFPVRRYLNKDTETMIQGSVGCSNRCFFCQSSAMDSTVSIRSHGSLIREVKQVLGFGFESIFFSDYDFCLNKKRLISFCKEIIKQKIKLQWACNMRADRIKDDQEGHDLLRLMKRSGCYRVFIGFESFSEKVLDNSNKMIDCGSFEVAAKIFRKYGISLHASFVFGLPGDTEKTIRETVKYAKKINPEVISFNILTPYPGTPIGDNPEKFGIHIEDKYWYEKQCPKNKAICSNNNLSCEKLIKLYKWAYVYFFNK